jgi:hypothetical protein
LPGAGVTEATAGEQGTLETREDAGEGDRGKAKLWLDAIDLQRKEDEKWRKRAGSTYNVYRAEQAKAKGGSLYAVSQFNILYANTEILAPAVYNSAPVPDVRERWSDGDPIARDAARVVERSLAYTVDDGDIGSTLASVTKDMLLPGRGAARVRWDPPTEGTPYEKVGLETVQWDEFILGPAKQWAQVQWIAFKHYFTREDFVRLNPEIGEEIDLDCYVAGAEKMAAKADGEPVPDSFKRGECWEVWDKKMREVVFVAPAHRDEPLAVVPDPYGLRQFFPMPEPAYALRSTNSLLPVEPFRLYADLADELDALTRRMSALIRAIKWRGAYLDPSAGTFLTKFAELDDGEFAPIENPAGMMQNVGGLDKAFWTMPIEQASATLLQLQEHREQLKATIYEITGVSDILRGATNPNETLGAQQIKERNGSLRVSAMQEEIARFSRDALRMMAELLAEKVAPETLSAMSGMQPDPQVFQLLRQDVLRCFRIDVETDSTIRADLQRQQANIGLFIQGLGAFIAAVAPAVQSGMMPLPLVAEMVSSFSRPFRLGRKVDEMLDQLPQMAMQQMAATGGVPPGAPAAPDPAAEAQNAQADRDHDMQKHTMTLNHQKEMEQMKAQAANPDMVGMQQVLGVVGQALTSLLQAGEATAHGAMQAAQAMDRQATMIEQAAQHAASPKLVQRDPGGNIAVLHPAVRQA